MSTHSTIRKVIAATVISTAIGLTTLAGSAVSADGPSLSDGTHTTAKKPGRTTFANNGMTEVVKMTSGNN